MTDHRRPEPDDARAALEAIDAQRLGDDQDRSVFARGTMLGGILLGAYVGLLTATAGEGMLRTIGLLALAGLAGLLLLWQSRRGRTVPLGARKTARAGSIASLVVAMIGIMAVNWLANPGDGGAGHQTPSALLCTLLVIAVALPLVLAGRRIASGAAR